VELSIGWGKRLNSVSVVVWIFIWNPCRELEGRKGVKRTISQQERSTWKSFARARLKNPRVVEHENRDSKKKREENWEGCSSRIKNRVRNDRVSNLEAAQGRLEA